MPNVLIIDDDQTTNEVFSTIVQKLGHNASSAFTIGEGLKQISSDEFDVVFLDVHLPDGNGIEVIPKIREADSVPEVIIVTGFGDPDGAELAIKNDAWDYITKPASIESLTLSLNRALDYRKEKKSKKLPVVLKRKGIIGKSAKINAILERVAQAAGSRGNILIVGETGTGKELIARAIHENSPLSHKRFVVVDCAALPESLVESILFGHEKGAYTGADKEGDGLIKQADGGTLFLDEVGELPLSVQKTFLRVIQEHKFRPIKGDSEINVDFRLIAATNRNLEEMVNQGHFRSDLLFRLQSLYIEPPPLRDRPEDIKELAIHHINTLSEIYATETKGVSHEFLEALTIYNWPGNVRELFNTLEEVLSAAMQDSTIFPYHLPTNIRAKVARMSVDVAEKHPPTSASFPSIDNIDNKNFPKIKEFRSSMDREYLQKLLTVSRGSRKEACNISGLSRTRLFELMKKYDISSDNL